MTKQGSFETADGVPIAWREDGAPSLPTLVLANSLGTTLSMWDPQIPTLQKRFRVIRFDTCGHGASGSRQDGFGMDRLGEDVLALLDFLNLNRVHFAGVSLGGMVGQWLGIHAPSRIEKLVLANTSAHMPTAQAWNDRREIVLECGMGAVAETVFSRWFTPEFRRNSANAIAMKEMLINCSTAGYAAACGAIRDMDFRDDLHKITAETLIIGGTRDQATPAEHSALLSARIAHSDLKWLDTAHLSNIEKPRQFTALVDAFL